MFVVYLFICVIVLLPGPPQHGGRRVPPLPPRPVVFVQEHHHLRGLLVGLRRNQWCLLHQFRYDELCLLLSTGIAAGWCHSFADSVVCLLLLFVVVFCVFCPCSAPVLPGGSGGVSTMIQSMSRSLSDSRRLSPLRRSGQHGSSRRDRETQAANKAAAGAQRRKRQKARRLNRERRSRGEESRSLGQLMTPGPGIPPRITLEDLGPEGLQMSGKWPYSTHSAAVWKVVYSCLVFLFSCFFVFLFSCSLVLLFSCFLVLLFSCFLV